MRIDLKQLSVRPVTASEEPRYRELMQQHHYLGDLAKIGHTLWYIATYKEVWIALLTFSASALKCAALTAGLIGIFGINTVVSSSLPITAASLFCQIGISPM